MQQTPRMERSEDRAKAWQSALKQCDFAGQIDLSEQDLRTIAPFVRQGFERYAPCELHDAARIVFAVNCAYYADEDGFWSYFCRLVRQDNEAATQTLLGRQIEESLMRFGFLIEPRNGPFRCVGPVLEQTGITRRSIPKFAEILQKCRETSWDEILTLTFNQFVKVVEELQAGTYLGVFLKSKTKSGWDFARSVARSLSQFESGRISWECLQSLPGYRPGFWKELKEHIDLAEADLGTINRQSAPLPRLVFDLAQAQVQIRFDHYWVERRAFTFENEVIGNSTWPLTQRADFKRHYCGQISLDGKNTREWEIRGWSMDSSEPVAIFQPQKGYIPPDAPVPEGLCFLLAPAGTQIPPTVTLLTEFEFVNISDAPYHFWQIEVSSDTDLAQIGYNRRQAAADIISWTDGAERFPASLEPGDVFLDQLPRLRVKSASLFRQNRLGLFLECGSSTQRIAVPGQADITEIPLPINSPSSGQVAVEPLGRLRRGDSAYQECKLEFTLLPRFPCSWPSGLHSPNDRPVISIATPPPLSVEFEECEQTAPGVWSAPEGCHFVEGVLHIPPRAVRLAWPIYRADFGREQNAQQRCFDVSEFDEDFQLHLSGLPSALIRFGLSAAQSPTGFDIPQTFDAVGHKRLSSFSFRDSFRKFTEPAGDILVWGDTSWVSTGASLLNLSALRDWLLSASQDESPQWFRSLDCSLRHWFDQVRNALATKATAPRFTPDPSLPPPAGAWADEIWLMLLAFNAAAPVEPAASLGSNRAAQINPEMLRTLRWVYAARRLVEHGHVGEGYDGDSLIENEETLTWRPSRREWADAIANLLAQLRQLLDLDAMVCEWAAEAIPPMRVVLRSYIANQTGGRELTEAYVCARQRDYRNAYRIADLLQPRTESALVRDLAFLLKTLVRFRDHLPLETPPTEMHRKLQPLFAGISTLVAAKDTAIFTTRSPRSSVPLDPNILPLHSSDIDLLRRAAGFPPA